MSGGKVKLGELDFSDVGAWPRHYKIGFFAILGALILILGNLIVFRGQREELEALRNQEATLRDEFASKAGRAESLQPLKRQIIEMNEALQQRLRKLPSKEQVPNLAVDISQIASSSGLNNEVFQPGPESSGAFYVEKPIALQMVGTYHQLGVFVSEVLTLPEGPVLMMQDISLQQTSDNATIQAARRLKFNGTIKVYRQMDEDETAAQEKITAQMRRAGANR